jgi:type IV pilus assembly protein PilW
MEINRPADLRNILRRRMSGFTLVELLVSMAIVGIVLGAIYSVFISQSRTASVQEQVVTMQKNLRSAIYFIEREVRMAGYNPTQASGEEVGGDIDCDSTDDFVQATDPANDPLDASYTAMTDESAAIGIQDAQIATLTFSRDLNGNGSRCPSESDENITYALNGLFLEKNGTPIAENIEAVYFEYLDADGNVTTSIGNVRQVVISVVGRTARPDAHYTDAHYTESKSYKSPLNTPVFTVPSGAEHYRRRLLSVQVDVRNIGS